MQGIPAKIVILTGAGVSAESGLGTFRDKGGVWTKYDLCRNALPPTLAFRTGLFRALTKGFVAFPKGLVLASIRAAQLLGIIRVAKKACRKPLILSGQRAVCSTLQTVAQPNLPDTTVRQQTCLPNGLGGCHSRARDGNHPEN